MSVQVDQSLTYVQMMWKVPGEGKARSQNSSKTVYRFPDKCLKLVRSTIIWETESNTVGGDVGLFLCVAILNDGSEDGFSS